MPEYSTKRPEKNPPHVTLKGLRKATGMRLDDVAAAVTEVLELEDGKKVNRGTISAIELGIRGASSQMLDAMAVAYGMEPGDIVTDFEPRQRDLGAVS